MASVSDIKLFNSYSYDDVKVNDETLAAFINVTTPERFVVHLMQHGRNSGQKRLAIRLFREACAIMHRLTKENPVQLLVDACINAGPKESSARIGRGGSMKRASADVSPYRRLNIALRLLSDGVRTTAFKNRKTMPEVIANEIMSAAKNGQSSYAVKKREEIERVAKSNR